MHSIGVDIGGSHVVSCMFEHSNKTLKKETRTYKKIDATASKNVIIEGWVSAIAKTLELADKEIAGIGIAMPGPFDYYNGISRIHGVNKLEALYGVNIRTELSEGLKIEPSKIRFINDASAFSIAEASVGRAANFQKVVAITLGTGFGASFLNNGRPLINVDNVPEGGCLYDKIYKGHMADDLFSTRGIINHYKKTTGNIVGNVRELAERAVHERDAEKVFQWFGTELGEFLAPFLSNFGAEILVIGGNISRSHALFITNLKDQLPQTEIYISELGEEAAIIGGSLLLEDNFYHSLTPTLKLM